MREPVQKSTAYTRLQYMHTIANDESFSLGDSEEESEFNTTLVTSRKLVLLLASCKENQKIRKLKPFNRFLMTRYPNAFFPFVSIPYCYTLIPEN